MQNVEKKSVATGAQFVGGSNADRNQSQIVDFTITPYRKIFRFY